MTEVRGLLTPFRRDRKRDFASGAGDDLLASKVEQVLGTEGGSLRSAGELPWRTAFGTPLEGLRHQRNDTALGELARAHVRDALARWLPEAKVVSLEVQRDGASLRLHLRFSAADQPSGAVTVAFSLLDQ